MCDVILNVYVDMSVECPSEESNLNKSSFIMRPFTVTDLKDNRQKLTDVSEVGFQPTLLRARTGRDGMPKGYREIQLSTCYI